jgi:aspartyl-tRNA(Asn)/glutamyl-tRNA(Gln) amidotransferase subunit C
MSSLPLAGFAVLGTAPATRTMALTLADVHRIAHLARIEIDAAAATEVHRKLEAIFAMINELQAVDTTGIVPMAHAQDVVLPLRDDVVTESDQHVLFRASRRPCRMGCIWCPG